jgi:hypothetical protein
VGSRLGWRQNPGCLAFVGTNPEAFGSGLPDSVTIKPKPEPRDSPLIFRGKQLFW